MIEKDLWESNDVQLKELLIIHEVCHLLEKKDYYKTLNIKLPENELKVGLKVHELVDKIDEMLGDWGNDVDQKQVK